MKYAVFGLFSFILSTAAFGWSQDGECPFAKIGGDLVTPHIDFASNPAKKLKVLVVAWGVGQREVVELKERFGYEPVLIPVANRRDGGWTCKREELFSPWDGNAKSGYGGSLTKEEYFGEVRKRLDELPSCDAILIGQKSWDVFPDWFRRRVADRVREGAGIVLIASRDRLVPFEDAKTAPIDPETIFPVSLVPSLAPTKCYAGTYGKGRVLQVVYRICDEGYAHPYDYQKSVIVTRPVECLTPMQSDHPLYYDFCHAFVGKCLWHVSPSHSVGRDASMRRPQSGHRPDLTTRVERVFNAEGEETVEGTAEARLKLVRWLNAKGETLDYAVSAPKTNAPVLASLSFERDAYRPAEEIRGEVKFARPAAGELRLTLRDDEGVLIYDGRVPRAFSLKLNHQQSRYARAKVAFVANGREEDAAWADLYFNTVDQDRNDFCFSIWSDYFANSRVLRLAHRQMRKLGVDNCMDTSYGGTTYKRKFEIPRWIKQTGMNYSTFITYVRGSGQPNEGVRDCGTFGGWDRYRETGAFPVEDKHFWHNETRVMDAAEGAKGLGVYFYNLGDENGLGPIDLPHECCFCDACQGRFRTYLKRTFVTLEKLNAAHGSKYASWDEIRAYPFMKSAKKRKMPLWMDYRAFMEEQFLNQHLLLKAQIEKFDPGAVMGVEGMAPPASSLSGWCFYKFLPHFRFAAPYFTSRDVHALQYLAPNAVRAAWYGTYEGQMSDAVVRRTPWRFLMYGLNGAFWWAALLSNNTFSNATIFRPDFLPLRQFDLSAKEVRTIKESGIGMLMVNAKPYPSGVAMHYSNPCLHASAAEPGLTTWDASIDEFGSVLEEAALPYSYLCPPDLEQGVPTDVKALVLPFSQAMSDAECAAVRAFVERGGVLVANAIPARLTEHGRVREASPLADLFAKEKLVPKRTGAGCAVWTDDYLAGAESRVSLRTAGGLVRGFRRILALGGVRPFATVTDEYGTICRADVFQNGDITLVGMLGPVTETAKKAKNAGFESAMKTTEAVGGSALRRVTLEKPMYGYDLAKGGKCLGRSTAFTIELPSVVGDVFAFTEKPARAPTVRLARKSVGRGEALDYSIDGVNGCIIVEVLDPTGACVFTERVNRKAARYVPPFDAKSGAYALRLRSVLGGLETEVAFSVAAPPGLNGDMEKIRETAKGMNKRLIRQIRDGSDFGPGPVAYTPEGWSINIGAAKFWSVDASEQPEEKPNVHGGSASMYVNAKKATHLHNQNCRLEPGRYRFSLWTKGKGSVSLITYNYRDAYHYVGCGRILLTAKGTNVWTRTEDVAEIGHEREGTTYSVPTLMFPAGSELWIDDLEIAGD